MKRLNLVLAAIGTAVFLIGGVSLAATPGDKADTLPEDARAYAATYGVSGEEALRSLELEEDAGRLGAALEANEAETFGDLEILHEPDFRVVAYFTRDGEQTIQRYVRGTPLEGMVETRQVDATLAELEAAQTEAVRYYEAQGVRVDSGIDVSLNRAEIYLPPKAQERLANTPAVQAARELPAPVAEVAVDALAAPMAYMYGGLATNPCTSGFTVRAKNGNEGFATAGHCDNTLTFNGTVMPFQKQNIRTTHDVQWHTSPSPYDDRAWFQDRDGNGSTYREVHSLLGRKDQRVGRTVCKSGKTTGYTCGKIIDRNYRPSYVGDAKDTFIRVDRGKRKMIDLGDSGAPVFIKNKAVGIAVAGKFGDMIYMPINFVAKSDLGISRVQTTR